MKEFSVLVAQPTSPECVPLSPVRREFLVGGGEAILDAPAKEALANIERATLIQEVEEADHKAAIGHLLAGPMTPTSPLHAFGPNPLEAFHKTRHRRAGGVLGPGPNLLDEAAIFRGEGPSLLKLEDPVGACDKAVTISGMWSDTGRGRKVRLELNNVVP